MLALRIAAASETGAAATGGGSSVDDETLPMLAQRAADRYSTLCAIQFAAEVPLTWPRRAAGARARVVVLVDADRLLADEALWVALASALQSLAARCEWGFAVFGDAARVVDRLQAMAMVAARVTQMPADPDIESARSLAAGDPDVLLDAAGLAWPVGPLLAARPARTMLGVSRLPHVARPLVDEVVAVDAASLQQALTKAVDAALAAPAAARTPSELQAQWAAAIDAHRNDRHADAHAAYDAILADEPAHAPTLHLRGVLRREDGDADGAAADFTAALAVAPADEKSRVALARMALSQHRVADARRIIAAAPESAAARVSLLRTQGHVALAERDGATAVNAFAAAVRTEPFDAETHFNHGVALQMLRYLGDAARAYQRALEIAPAMLDAHFNLGVVFEELGETDSAITALEYVIAQKPAGAEAHRALLDVLARHERGAQWMRAFERFEQHCPDALGLVANALEYYQYMGDYAKVHRYIDRLSKGGFKPANELDLVDSLEQLLYLMLFFDVAPDTQAALYATYDKAARRVYGEPIARAPERRPGRLRVGYLSADFRDHVMGRMMLDVIRHHDRGRFDVRLYSTAIAADDDVTAAFRAAADAFVVVAQLADEAAVAMIAEDDLDVLVDLSSHTRGARQGIIARKPTRVAITHVASAGALGMSAVDFKLTDHRADLPDNDRHYVETLLPMEGCVYPLRRMTPAPGHPYQRAALGIADDAVVIGAFVTPLKLSRRTTALWREILDRLPNAVLAFSPNAGWLRDTYPAILGAAGIDPFRTIMVPQGGDEAHNLARYAVVDFVLDPMPFGNVNGTIEPLNMGVPVVTLVGQTHGERTGYSILESLGETRTIATSGKEYVDIAVRLATDAGFMRDVRASIRARLDDPANTDAAAYARRLEAAFDIALAARLPGITDGVAR
jgi:predicted O-linked N-acetylglucosamine transferase (SPINDLY family)